MDAGYANPYLVGNSNQPTQNRVKINRAIAFRCSHQTLTAATTLTELDSNGVFFLDLAGGFTVTLPTATAGLKYTFIVKTAPTTAYIILSATADTMIGYPVASSGGDESSNGNAAGDQVNFVASTSLAGDKVEVISDGTSWHVYAHVKATGSVTITG